MDFITKLFTRCMAFAVVAMPYYGFAALNASLETQQHGRSMPNVGFVVEQSKAEAFKKQVDDLKHGAKKKRYVRKTTVRRPGAGIIKGIFAAFAGYAAYASLGFSSFFLIMCLLLPFHALATPFSLCLVALGLIAFTNLVGTTRDLGTSAFHDISGRDEYVVIQPDEYEDYEILCRETEEERRKI